MKRTLFVAVWLCMCATLSKSSDLCDCFGKYIQRNTLQQLAQAKSEADLRKAWMSKDYPDSSISIIFAVQLHHFNSSRADVELIESIPHNPVELWYSYCVFRSHDLPTERALGDLFWEYWTLVPAAIERQKYGTLQFLQLSGWATEGEMMDALDTGNEILWSGDRARFMDALKRLDPKTRERICSDEMSIIQCSADNHQTKEKH